MCPSKGGNGMGVVQGVSFGILLIAALYGFAQAWLHLAQIWLMPKEKRICLFLPLEGHVENVEEHIRAAQWMAKRQNMRLLVVDVGTDEETRRIAQTLLHYGCGEWIAETDETGLRDT